MKSEDQYILRKMYEIIDSNRDDEIADLIRWRQELELELVQKEKHRLFNELWP